MDHAVITGATGFIGGYLVKELLGGGVRVTALCREGSRNTRGLPPEAAVVTEAARLEKADTFYHLAWESATGAGRKDPLVQCENAQMTIRALLTAHRLGCRRFIALGTVYERLAPRMMASGGFMGPDFYVLAKGYARDMASQLAYRLGLEFVWGAICHPVGAGMKPDQFMTTVISGLLMGESPALGSAATLYDMTAVEDVAYALALLGHAERLKRRSYYIGSGQPKPLKQWLQAARTALGTETPLRFGARPDDGLRFRRHWFQIAPLKAETGYVPKVAFAEAARRVAESIY